MTATPAPSVAHQFHHVARQADAVATLADRHGLDVPFGLLETADRARKAALADPCLSTHAALQTTADRLRRFLVAAHCQLGHVDSVPARLRDRAAECAAARRPAVPAAA